jgi:hypothetical protein
LGRRSVRLDGVYSISVCSHTDGRLQKAALRPHVRRFPRQDRPQRALTRRRSRPGRYSARPAATMLPLRCALSARVPEEGGAQSTSPVTGHARRSSTCNISASGHDDRRFQLLQMPRVGRYPSRRRFEAHPRSPAGTRPTGTARLDREVSQRTGSQCFQWNGNAPQAPQASDLHPILGGRDLEPRWNLRGSVHLDPAAREEGQRTYRAFKQAEQRTGACGLPPTIGGVLTEPQRAASGSKEAGRVNRWQKSNNRSLSDCPMSWRPHVGRMATMYKHLVDPVLCRRL